MTIEKKYSPKARQDRMGYLLAESLELTGAGECLSDQDISALAEGTVKGETRDRMLKHVASCIDCYEIFQLISDIQADQGETGQKEETGAIVALPIQFPEKRKRNLYKPLALAASVLIAVFSVYIFYRGNDIPRSVEDMAMKTDTAAPRAERLLSPKNKAEAEKRSDTLSGQDNAKGRGLREKANPYDLKEVGGMHEEIIRDDRGQIRSKENIVPGSKTLSKPKVPIVSNPPGPTDLENAPPGKKLSKLKKNVGDSYDKNSPKSSQSLEYTAVPAKKQAAKREKVEQRYGQTAEGNAQEKQQVGYDSAQELQRQVTARPRSHKNEGSGPEVRQQTGISTVQQQPIEEKRQSVEPPALADKVRARLNVVNTVFRASPAFLPASRIRQLFRETLTLNASVKTRLENLRSEAVGSGDPRRMNTYIRELAPAVTATASRASVQVTPNISYFQSKSKPGTPEYRFFTLARSGWCDGAGNCYNTGKGDKMFNSPLLRQWQELYPQLTGIFRDIAAATMRKMRQRK